MLLLLYRNMSLAKASMKIVSFFKKIIIHPMGRIISKLILSRLITENWFPKFWLAYSEISFDKINLEIILPKDSALNDCTQKCHCFQFTNLVFVGCFWYGLINQIEAIFVVVKMFLKTFLTLICQLRTFHYNHWTS